MVLHEKPTKNLKFRGLKFRGLMWNQISTPNFTYQNDRRNKIYTVRYFENKTTTHMDATHAISKSERDFQNRIPRELDKKFYIPRFVVIHWITSNIQIFKIRLYKKVMAIFSPGIQSKYRVSAARGNSESIFTNLVYRKCIPKEIVLHWVQFLRLIFDLGRQLGKLFEIFQSKSYSKRHVDLYYVFSSPSRSILPIFANYLHPKGHFEFK